MNKRIENLVKRIEKNDGKRITLRRDILVKMAEEQLFDYMDSYSYDETFGESRKNGVKGSFIEVCQDVQRSHGGSCYVSLIGSTLKFDCYVHSNNFFDLYIELEEDKRESEEVEILEDVRVELNENKNGVEIYFSNKPSEEVRNNLKSHGFRWSKFNKCWYAKQSEDTLNFANSLLPKEDDKINDLSEVAVTQEENKEEFYIKNENREYEKIEGFRLKNKYNFDLFYHKSVLGNWKITHTATGIGVADTLTAHKENLLNKLDDIVNKNGLENVEKMFNHAIDKEGYAPGKNPYTDNEITISLPQNDSLDMNLQLLANEKTSNNDIKINCKEVLKETKDYILFKKGSIYVLRYFDECFNHEKYDRNKKITQSRITKYYDNIKHLLE